ncbi:MAG: o-succinylbenzoate--CoA ligase [Phycisphaerae bacterium]|nr:o-succinylbenzoate--CoA ligase [Phycisphaerae bacterium]
MLDCLNQTVAKLTAAGIAPGDRIAILSEPSVEFVKFTLACWKLGVVVVPISTRYPPEKRKAAADSVKCKRFLASSTHSRPPMLPMSDFVCAADLPTITFDELALSMDADASIIFTSGTSGEPKGVLHTIANHYYSALGSHENIPFGRGDAWLPSLPMYHVGGFSLIMRALIAAGRILFPQPNQPLADALMHPAVTHLSLVPAQLIRLLDQSACVERLKKLKAVLLGGDAMPPTLLDRACDLNLPVCITYGSTEAASQIATSAPGRPREGAKLLPHRELKTASDGEICLKGQILFKGYIHADAIDPARDSEGFFHTGDIGALDENNTLRVTGRKDLMFISGGENIHPEEIERALMSLPNIEQAIVVPIKDPQFGHRPAAFIKPAHNAQIDTGRIRIELKKYLEPFKIPIVFRPWPGAVEMSPKPIRKQLADYV